MARVDPGLKRLLARRGGGAGLVTAAPAGARAVPQANVMVELDGASAPVPDELADAGFVAGTRAGAVLTGTLPLESIDRLEDIPGLRRAELSRPTQIELVHALPEARVTAVHTGPPGLSGNGVIVGIIDTGIDFRHRSFRNADGSSRILAIWDQALTPRTALGERTPGGFTYGVEYTRDAIDRALRSTAADPTAIVAHRDGHKFHGTHVAGIAAGNGHPSTTFGNFRGVAPKADIIVVANTRDQRHDPGSLGDSADTLDAVSYILKKANERRRPVVINLSQGDNVGPHDGTSLIEVALDAVITGPGRVLVKSAGNGGTARTHTSGTLVAGTAADIPIAISVVERQAVIDIWYARDASLVTGIAPPTGRAAGPFSPPFHGEVAFDNGNLAFVAADLNDPANGDNRAYIALEAKVGQSLERGAWTIRLEGRGPWQAWLQSSSGLQFERRHASPHTTLTIPGTAKSVISVTAYVSDQRFGSGTLGDLSELSSFGPTRDGRRAPTIAAPGAQVHSAQPGNHFAPMKGTSQAAAMVSGAVALMLEARPASTADEIRLCLEQSARSDSFTGSLPNHRWGAGKLDVKAAIQRLRSLP